LTAIFYPLMKGQVIGGGLRLTVQKVKSMASPTIKDLSLSIKIV